MAAKSKKSNSGEENPPVRTPDGIEYNGKRYIQFIIRNFRVTITDLHITRTVSNYLVRQDHDHFRSDPRNTSIDYSASNSNLHLSGTGKIDFDTLGVIGQPDMSTSELSVTLYRADPPGSDGIDRRWKAQIFVLPFDWEIGNPEEWPITVQVPAQEFDVLYDCVDRGKFGGASLSLETDLWAEELDRHAPPSAAVRWYLGPGSRRSPEAAVAVVSGFHWIALPDNSSVSSKESSLSLMSEQSRQRDGLVDEAIAVSIKKPEANPLRRPLEYIAGAIIFLGLVLAFRW